MVKKTPLRTGDKYFQALPAYPFEAHYRMVSHPGYGKVRMHYVDEGEEKAPPVLLLHGCPAWSYLYRKTIARLLEHREGSPCLRVLAPDHIGCGKSDKLLHREDYNYDFYVSTIRELVLQLDLTRIMLVCQDWGGPIGLRVACEMPERFRGIVLTNTLLPNCEVPPGGIANWPGEIIRQWVDHTRQAQDMSVGSVIQGVCVNKLAPAELAAYDAPFPNTDYKQGILNWPSLIPLTASSPGIAENRKVWDFLEQSKIPVLTAFSDGDPSTADWEAIFQQRAGGARGQHHVTIKGAGHMVQEDKGEELADIIQHFFVRVNRRASLPSQ